MLGMMGKIKDVQSKVKAAKDNLVHLSTTGESGAGMVKATVNGNRQLIKLEIDPSLITPEDKEMLQDLTLAAVNTAMKDIESKIAAEMKKATEGMLPNIPGMDLNSLLG